MSPETFESLRTLGSRFGIIIRAIDPSSRGLGDTVAKVTKAVGIKPCGGCKKRQAILNKLVPTQGPINEHQSNPGSSSTK